MTAVEISRWQKGCNGVAAIKEIRAKAGIPLNEAHALVNRVLANEKAVVCVPSRTDALQLVEELGRVGMIAQIMEDSVTETSALSTASQGP